MTAASDSHLSPEVRFNRSTSAGPLHIAVLSVPFGGGHRAVADGLHHAITEDSRELEAVVLDAMDLVSGRFPLRRWTAWLYRTLTRPAFRPVYGVLFRAVDRWPEVFGRLSSLLFRRRAERWLETHRPDIVVSTYPLVSYVFGEAIRRASTTDFRVRLVTFVTDGGQVNRSWFAGRVHGFAVTNDETRRFAGQLNIKAPVVAVDLPLRAGFYRALDPAVARSRLQLGSQPIVLVWGGGQGLARGVEPLIDELLRGPDVVTPVVVTGTNRRLARRLRRRTATAGVRVLEECADVPSLLNAVDVVVGKAGWVSLSEARATGLATICIDALPGQERENLRVSRSNGSASWVPDPREAAQLVRRIRQREGSARAASAPAADNERLCALIIGDMSERRHHARTAK
jgi:processive 1,2-diacylglycerol beta-glucosyltransferase